MTRRRARRANKALITEFVQLRQLLRLSLSLKLAEEAAARGVKIGRTQAVAARGHEDAPAGEIAVSDTPRGPDAPSGEDRS
jgi:hypothetical protein